MRDRTVASFTWPRRVLTLLLSGAAIWLAAGLAEPVRAIVYPREQVVEIQIIGIACGSHLRVAPNHFAIRPGSFVRIVNRTPWPQELRLTARDAYSASALAASESIPPDGSWRVRLWRPGAYFVVSENQWQYLAGLRGGFSVQSWLATWGRE